MSCQENREGRLKFHAFLITSTDEGGRPLQALSALRTDKLNMTSNRFHCSSGCYGQAKEKLPIGNIIISRIGVL